MNNTPPNDPVPEVSTSSDVAMPTRRSKSRLKSTGKICASLAGVCFVILIAAGVLGLYVQRNSIPADFIRDRLARNLEQEFGGNATVQIGEVRIGGNQDYLATQVLDLVVRGANGQVMLSAPDARIDLSPTALARLELVAQRITLKKIDLGIDISPDGVVSIANSGAQNSVARPVSEVAASILAFFNGTMGVGGAPIPVVALENGRLQVNDRRRDRQFSLEAVRISADPMEDGRPAIQVAGVTPGGRVAARIAPGREPLTFELLIDRVTPADFAAITGDEIKFVNSTLPISLDINTRVNEEGVPKAVHGKVTFGAGQLLIDDPDAKPIEFVNGLAVFAYDAGAQPLGIKIETLSFDAGGVKMSLTGSLDAIDASHDAWSLKLSGKQGSIEPITEADHQVVIARQSLDALIYPKLRTINLLHFDLEGPDFSASMDGKANFDEMGRMALKLGLGIGKAGGRTALHLWPAFVASPLRNYLVKNLKSGTLNKLTVAADLSVETFQRMKLRKPMPDEAITANFSMSDTVLQVVPGLSPLANATLEGRSTGLTTNLNGINATMALPSGKTLALNDGTFSIDDLGRKPVEAKSQFRLAGAAEAVLELIAQPAMQGVLPSNAKSDGIKGQFDGQVSITLPLIDKLGPSDVSTQIKANLNNVSAEHFFGKDKFEAQQMQLTVQPGSMTLKGDGKVGGMVASVDVVQPRRSDAEDAIVTLVLDDAARVKRGFNVGTQLTGPVSIKIKSDFPVNTKAGFPVEIDLAKAAVDGLLPGWTKPIGKPSRVKFILTEKDGAYKLTNFDLDGAGPVLKGSLDIAADGNINGFQFGTFKLSPGDNVQADAQKTQGGLKINVRGNSFDARPFLRGASKNASSATKMEIDLDIKVVALVGFNGEIASNGEVKILRKGAQIKQGLITGRLNGDLLLGKISPKDDGTSVLNLQSDNAGSLMRFMDIYSRMQGGHLDAQVNLSGLKEKGWFLVRNFGLRDEPALQRVAAAAVAEDGSGNPQRPALAANGGEISFQRMRVDFSRNGDVFNVSEGVMWGREIGGTIFGQMDYGRDRIDLSGTFVPAYGLNNAFAKIPVLGLFLSGNKNEGLFAVPFRVTGRASSPSVSINPIAAVSPGFLRKIFDFQAQPTAQVDVSPDDSQ